MPEDVSVDAIQFCLELFGSGVAAEFGKANGGVFDAVLLQKPAGTIGRSAPGQLNCGGHTSQEKTQCRRSRLQQEQIAWQR